MEMIFDDLAAFRMAVPRGRALMGLDLGTATIGVAVSDRKPTGNRIAFTPKRKGMPLI